MKKVKNFIILSLLMCFSTIIKAQDETKESTVGKFMRSNQRSYVVIAVIIVILTGLVIYLIRLDKKISKLEKQ